MWSAELALAFGLPTGHPVSCRISPAGPDTVPKRTVPPSPGDFDTEQAVLDVLRRERPADAVVGEEVGPQPGNAARRWILDGIDGTHNFAFGRPGWATAIALEVDGEVVVALLSAPALGRRWWAVRGGGAWSASVSSGTAFDAAAAEPIRVGGSDTLGERQVIPSRAFRSYWRER